MGARVSSSSSEDVFPEDSNSNALSLVYDSEGDSQTVHQTNMIFNLT